MPGSAKDDRGWRDADFEPRRPFMAGVSRWRVVFVVAFAAVVLVDGLAPVRRYVFVAVLVGFAGWLVLGWVRRLRR